jgi:hypothetical protein
MKVEIMGKVLDIPEPLPTTPESLPVCMDLKKLVEDEFFMHFNRKLNIKSWDYIFQRASAYRIN